MEDFLSSKCGAYCTKPDCPEAVKESPSGRWFITMGHPGFNSPTNNRSGYVSKDKALVTYKKYSLFWSSRKK